MRKGPTGGEREDRKRLRLPCRSDTEKGETERRKTGGQGCGQIYGQSLRQRHPLEESSITLQYLGRSSHWLVEACRKGGLRVNVGVHKKRQQMGTLVGYASCSRREI